MSDLQEVIARWRRQMALRPISAYRVDDTDLTKLLDAAESGMTARDAALEEAAQEADKARVEALALPRPNSVAAALAEDIAANLRARRTA